MIASLQNNAPLKRGLRKMWRSINFILVLLCLFGRFSFAADVCITEDPSTSLEQSSIMPVQFVSYENEILTALFVSKIMSEKMEFHLASVLEHGLFETNGEWEEEISRKTFLKKIKKDYWMVVYKKAGEKNVLCGAHQFKNLESLRINYGQASDNLLKTVDTIAYWRTMKVRPLAFYAVEEERGCWLFLTVTDEPLSKENEYVELENKQLIPQIFKTKDNTHLQVVEHGVFTIAKNCVFHILETKPPKKVRLPMTDTGITLGRPRARVKSVDKAYFIENMKKYLWLCFFDEKAGVLLRIVQMPETPEENGNNNKNDKEPTEKKLKNEI